MAEIIFLVDLLLLLHSMPIDRGGCRGRDRMVVGFLTTCAIGAYHLECFEFNLAQAKSVFHEVKTYGLIKEKHILKTCGRSVVFSGYYCFLHQ